MIAAIVKGKAILLTTADFCLLADRLMTDLPSLECMAFKTAVAENLAIWKAKEKLHQWESVFCSRLLREIQDGRVRPNYEFDEAEARRCVEDYLEAYRYNFRLIDFSVATIHDGSDNVIRISLRQPQSLLDRAMNRYGTAFDEINFLRHDITGMIGNSLSFRLMAGRFTYRFDSDGARSC